MFTVNERVTIMESWFPNERRVYAWALVGTCVILALPLLTLEYAPFVDYPNHLARVFILRHYDDNPIFQAAFRRDLTVMPNLGMDLAVTPLLWFVDLTTASRLFLALTVVTFALGCHRLAAAVHGRPSWVALPCAFTVLSSPFMNGFMNYMFGVGAFFLTLAAWLTFRQRRTVLRYLAVCAACLASFVIHLSTLAFLGVAIGVVLLFAAVRRRSITLDDLIDGSVLIPLALAFLRFRPQAGERSPTIWNTVGGKAVALLAPVRTYDMAFDIILIVCWVSVVLYAFRARRSVRIHWPLLSVALVMFIGFLISPQELFSSSGADARFVLPAVVLTVMSISLVVPAPVRARLVVAALTLSVVRLGALWLTWGQLSAETGRLITVIDQLPVGAAVFAEQFESGEPPDVRRRTHALGHTIQYATIRRSAVVSSLFTVPGVQPLVWRDGRRVDHMIAANALESVRGYDFVWTGHAPPDVRAALIPYASVVAAPPGYELWRVDRAAVDRAAQSQRAAR